MKKIKITWNGQPLREVYAHATRWQVFKYRARNFFRKVLIVIGVLMTASSLTAIAFAVGMQYAPTKTLTVSASDAAYPVLDRIAICESGGKQNDSTGQVLMHINKNNTVDVGKYAINSKWFKQATQLGYDLTKESDNKAMAFWIYTNRGTEDWYSSKQCWEK